MVLCQDPGALVPIPIPRAQVSYAIWYLHDHTCCHIHIFLLLPSISFGYGAAFHFWLRVPVTDRLPRLLGAHLYNPIPWRPVYSILAYTQLLITLKPATSHPWDTAMATAAPRREYELTVRQEPKQARMCGVGGK